MLKRRLYEQAPPWAGRLKETGPNSLVGTLFLRSHMAKVGIQYNKTAYSINYMDSNNLKYDGSKIHSNYNGWVQNLDRAIQTQLLAM